MLMLCLDRAPGDCKVKLLPEQYVWVKVPQASSHQGGNTKGIFNLLIFIEVFLV